MIDALRYQLLLLCRADALITWGSDVVTPKLGQNVFLGYATFDTRHYLVFVKYRTTIGVLFGAGSDRARLQHARLDFAKLEGAMKDVSDLSHRRFGLYLGCNHPSIAGVKLHAAAPCSHVL